MCQSLEVDLGVSFANTFLESRDQSGQHLAQPLEFFSLQCAALLGLHKYCTGVRDYICNFSIIQVSKVSTTKVKSL